MLKKIVANCGIPALNFNETNEADEPLIWGLAKFWIEF